MKIFDKEGNLLSIVIKKSEIQEGRNFYTDNHEEVQLAAFDFKKETIIENHIHNKQKREIFTTSETLIVLDGSMTVSIFDENLNFVKKIDLSAGDTISLIKGGHGINIEKSCKFIETKQGPYNPKNDKKRF